MGHSKSKTKDVLTDASDSSTFYGVLISSFSTIFLAELGDKTQIATLMLSAQSGRPLIIFFGAALALISTSILGVIIGRWIANNFPRKRFTLGAGIIMISLGLFLSMEAFFDFLKSHQLSQ